MLLYGAWAGIVSHFKEGSSAGIQSVHDEMTSCREADTRLWWELLWDNRPPFWRFEMHVMKLSQAAADGDVEQLLQACHGDHCLEIARAGVKEN